MPLQTRLHRGQVSEVSTHLHIAQFGMCTIYVQCLSSFPSAVLLVTTATLWCQEGDASPASAAETAIIVIPGLEVSFLLLEVVFSSGNLDPGSVCDPQTLCFTASPVCKNTLEPGDTDTDEQCQGETT